MQKMAYNRTFKLGRADPVKSYLLLPVVLSILSIQSMRY